METILPSETLEQATAELLSKQDAVYMPIGTMTNQVGIRVYTEPGDAALFDQSAHVYVLEGGAPAEPVLHCSGRDCCRLVKSPVTEFADDPI
jgi:7-keto-8-aminopelargonate synthetase-like enzyme